MVTPTNQRPNDVFLSHSSRDKNAFVDDLYTWLTRHAGYKVWFDRGLGSGFISSGLNEAIDTCRGAIIVLSHNSVKSPWVNSECDRIHKEWADRKGEFRIATVRLDPVDAHKLLQSFKHIDITDGKLTPDAAALLIETLNGSRDSSLGKPVYMSRGWRENERVAAEKISGTLKNSGLKLVCDWTDQPHYNAARVRDIMDSTGGLVAIMPNRGQGSTSSYILREIELARELKLPILVFYQDGLTPRPEWEDGSVVGYNERISSLSDTELEDLFADRIERFANAWIKPKRGEHVFLGHSLEESINDRFSTLRRMISRMTGLPVVSGGLVTGSDAQVEIARLIDDAEFCIIDITNNSKIELPERVNFALNSCIEAGIAIGAGKGSTLYLTYASPRRSPPFMFRNKQVWFYGDELELIGNLRQIAFLHRRMVL